MSNIQRLHSETRYSEIVIHSGTIYLAGQLADNLEQGIEGQTRETLASIEHLLQEAGSDKSRLLSVTVYLNNMAEDYAAFNALWDAWLATGTAPARACVQAPMYSPKVRVELSVIAAVKS